MSNTEKLIGMLEAPGFPASSVRKTYSEIAGRYDEPWRHYHTAKHLYDVVDYLVENADDLHDPRVTLWSAIGHDVIYMPKHGDNEEMSAQLMEDQLADWLPSGEVSRVGNYIRATTNHFSDGDDDLAMLLDADLKILGAEPAIFAQYDHGIGQEYGFYDKRDYTLGRLAVLRGFYDRPRIYITDTAYNRFEKQAKQNLREAITEYENRAATI